MSLRKVKLPNGEVKWQVRVYANGRGSQRISRRFERRADAEAFLRNHQNELVDRKTNPYRQAEFEVRTFRTEAENWLKSGEIRFSPGTYKKAKVIVENMLKSYGDIPIPKFTAEIATRFQREEKAKGLEDASVNRKCQVMIAILNFAVKQRRIPYNPAQGFQKLREAEKEALFWSQEEASAFLGFADLKYPKGSERRWIYTVYLLALNTGLRSGEIWGLKPDDLSPIANVISVRRQLNAVTGKMGPTKSRKGRIVPCSKDVMAEIKDVIEQNKKRFPDASDLTIFCNERGAPFDHKNFFHRIFVPDMRAWGGKRIRFHDLRHTATTLMIAAGVDIKTVKEICGHSDISTTMNYVHLVASAIEKVPLLFSIAPTKITTESDEVR